MYDATTGLKDFYPRPPRGGRPSRLPQTYTEYIFLSTPSARRATTNLKNKSEYGVISIHALREEGDNQRLFMLILLYGISIHALREEGDAVRRKTKTALEISIHALREEGDKN